MNLYVWKRLEYVTENWHPEGGVAIIAESLDAARALFTASEGAVIKSEPADILTTPPDFSCPCDAPDAQLFIFPDTGCC